MLDIKGLITHFLFAFSYYRKHLVVQFLIGCCQYVPDGFFVLDELYLSAVKVGYDCTGLLGDVNSREYIDEGLSASEVTVYFTLGDIHEAVRATIGVEEFERFQYLAILVNQREKEFYRFHSIGFYTGAFHFCNIRPPHRLT